MSKGFQQAVTDFIFISDQPEQSDIIFIPGSAHDAHVKLAAELYLAGYAPLVLPSGKYPIDADQFSDPLYDSEWAWMKSLLIGQGVPESSILCENQARFTWDNAVRSRQITDQNSLQIKRAIICCRPFHARRALFYYQSAYPQTQFFVCPCAEIGLEADDWHQTPEGRRRVLGEVRRMGSQINEVWEDMLMSEMSGR